MARTTNDPDGNRQNRLEALRRIAERDGDGEPTLRRVALGSARYAQYAQLASGGGRRSGRRWLIPVVAGALVVVVIAVAVLGVTLNKLGAQKSATVPVALKHVITIPASAHIYCPSMPAWSPDGKYIAVMARVFQPGGQSECDYGDQVSNSARQELTGHGPGGSFYAGLMTVLALDAKTGVLVRQLKPVDLAEMLCKGASYCDASHITPVSLSWTPDGASVLLFATLNVDLTGPDGQGYSQTRGALTIMRADGTKDTRALIAYGRATSNATGPGGGILPVNIYSPPLFTWDLTTGSASYTDIHEAAGMETIDYAPSFQVGPTGKLTPAPSAGSITPWSYGALSLNTYGPAPVVQFQSSVWAWSVDGRYVSPDVDTVAYINVTNAAPTAPPSYPGAYKPLFVAPPDAVTAAVVREITPQLSVIYVARDPRGARLASFACQPNLSIGKLTIRATATGKTLLTTQYSFPTASTAYNCPGDAEAINWSPDGSHVAMTDSLDNQIIIWQIPEKV